MPVPKAPKEVVSVVEALRKSPPAEGKVLLRNVSWETYERLILEREERRVPRFFYDRGVMELMSPSYRHESVSRVIASLIDVLVVDLDVSSAGSTTFRRENLRRGFEPDESFYFGENARYVRGKVNLVLDAGDPPPDLLFEADLTSPSLDKLPIYAYLGVREVWRYIGAAPDSTGRMEVLLLLLRGGEEPRYEAAAQSAVLPPLTSGDLTSLVEEGLVKERPAWIRRVREWAPVP